MNLVILQMDSGPQSSQEIALFVDAMYAEAFKALGLTWLQKNGSFLKGVRRSLSSTRMFIELFS